MDCWMDKELAEWLYPESCSQWLSVQVETSNEWRPSSACSGTSTFTAFINDIASGTVRCLRSLSEFADGTKLSDAFDNAQGKD